MSASKFGFYFEASGRAPAQGAIAPAEEFFEGSLAEVSLARETGQNSIDARGAGDPVVMVFELATMCTDSIPGIAGLRRHIEQVDRQTIGSQGHDRMRRAHETAQLPTIPVLRIGDYGLRGLLGRSPSMNPIPP